MTQLMLTLLSASVERRNIYITENKHRSVVIYHLDMGEGRGGVRFGGFCGGHMIFRGERKGSVVADRM